MMAIDDSGLFLAVVSQSTCERVFAENAEWRRAPKVITGGTCRTAGIAVTFIKIGGNEHEYNDD